MIRERQRTFTVNSVEEFHMIIDNLVDYVANTQPPLMPAMSEEYAAHQA